MKRLILALTSLLLLLSLQVAADTSFTGRFELTADAAYVGSESCMDCHDDIGDFYKDSPHAVARNLSIPGTAIGGCEACHGPGSRHIEEDGEGFIITAEILAGLDEAGKADMCTQCHIAHRTEWAGGPHAGSGTTCADCHADQVHFGGTAKPAGEFGNPAEFCLQCHTAQVADFRMPFRHRVLEGQITCGDCHDPHAAPAENGWNGLNETCLNCHQEMAGPFVFEHEGVADEDCTVCHRPHGSMNDKLLASDGSSLCLQCHFDIQFLDVDESIALGTFPHGDVTGRCGECHAGSVSGGPHLAAGGEARCYDCHYEIHGSNVSPTFRNQ